MIWEMIFNFGIDDRNDLFDKLSVTLSTDTWMSFNVVAFQILSVSRVQTTVLLPSRMKS